MNLFPFVQSMRDTVRTITLADIHADARAMHSLLAQVFRDVLDGDGRLPEKWERSVNLMVGISEESRLIKAAAIYARDVVLARRRLMDMLYRYFESVRRGKPVLAFLSRAVDVLAFDSRELQEYFYVFMQNHRQGIIVRGNEASYEKAVYRYLRANLEILIETGPLSAALKNEAHRAVEKIIHQLMGIARRPILAHRVRGYAGDESSKEALRQSLAAHAAEIEFDIRVSRDGAPIIHHNATLGETAGIHRHVKDMTAAQLMRVTLNSGEHLTSLRHLFDTVRETGNEVTMINIDIKDFDIPMLDRIVDLVRRYRFEHRVRIVSWFPQVLQYIYERDPNLQFGFSYYPLLRLPIKLLFKFILKFRGPLAWDIPGAGIVSRFKALRRKQAIGLLKTVPLKSYRAEVRRKAFLVHPKVYWKDMLDRVPHEELTGNHPFAMASAAPVFGSSDMAMMAEVLFCGRVNLEAFEEKFRPLLAKIPIVKNYVNVILDLGKRLDRFYRFAAKCRQNLIKVSLFDLVAEAAVKGYFEHVEAQHLRPGPLYSSNEKLVPSLCVPVTRRF